MSQKTTSPLDRKLTVTVHDLVDAYMTGYQAAFNGKDAECVDFILRRYSINIRRRLKPVNKKQLKHE